MPRYQLAVEKVSFLPVLKSVMAAKQRHILATGKQTANIDDLDIQLPSFKTHPSGAENAYISGIFNVQLYENAKLVVVSAEKGYIVDYYYIGKGLCYPHRSESLGEKICQGLGKHNGRISSVNTKVYDFEF